MKTYATWEVIKALTIDDRLKFECLGVNLNVDEDGFLIGEFNDHKGINGNVNLHKKWILVQQSVTFMEAIKALSQGKTIRHDGKFPQTFKNIKCDDELEDGSLGVSPNDILNCKWYIEEKEGE